MKNKLTTTLDPEIIDSLTKEAKAEARSVSGMLNVILSKRYKITPKKVKERKPKLIRRGKAA